MKNETRKELHLKYRPDDWDLVIGQDETVRSLKRIIEERTVHSFLFTGPSGCGKTTLARLCAQELGVDSKNILEVDAASQTGVDDWRKITSTLDYKPIGGGPRAIIVDEAHGLSKNAWESLLKDVEEPPEHLFWFICTTEDHKVPKTIKTRCTCYAMKPVELDVLTEWLSGIAAVETGEDDAFGDIIDVVCESAAGSPRDALTMLAQVWDAESASEASKMLATPARSKDVIDLCRGLVSGKLTWTKAMDLLRAIENPDPEGIRCVVQAYVAKVAMGAKTNDKAGPLIEILDAFSDPMYNQKGIAPIVVAIGRVLL